MEKDDLMKNIEMFLEKNDLIVKKDVKQASFEVFNLIKKLNPALVKRPVELPTEDYTTYHTWPC